jgi:LysM repeat protein
MISKRLSIAALAVATVITAVLLSIFVPSSAGKVNSLYLNKLGTTSVKTGQSSATETLIPASTNMAPVNKLAQVSNLSNLPVVVTYKVRRGNTLSGIAEKFELTSWKKLYCANEETIGNKPWLLEPGTQIRIRESRHVWCKISFPSQVVGSGNNNTIATVFYPPQSGGTFSGSGGFQSCVIAAESGGNAQVMNSTGHYGLYQFSYSTWVANGGPPGDFGHASVSEQNQVFYNTIAKPGGYMNWSPYDGCWP